MKTLTETITQPTLFQEESAGSTVYCGDAYQVLSHLPPQCCHMAVTSPPYWGLRDYELPGQIGSEPRVDDYINSLVLVFRELRRVLRDDGTLAEHRRLVH